MPNNDENKPIRKTWTMIKKAIKEIEFVNNILPAFSNETLTASDKYGIWTLTSECIKNSKVGNIGLMLDHDEATCGTSTNNGWNSSMAYITISLPNNVSIKPKAMQIKSRGYSYFTHYIQGFNTETQKWETITNSTTPKNNNTAQLKTFTVKATALNTFYTQFRIVACDSYTGAAGTSWIYDFQITEGTIKYQ